MRSMAGEDLLARADEVEAFIKSLNLSNGMRFLPTDKEIVGHFLIGKIRRGAADDEDDRIKVVDLYSIEPWIIWDTCPRIFDGDESLYLYTQLKMKENHGSPQIDRRVAAGTKGTWRGEGLEPDSPIICNYHRTTIDEVNRTEVVTTKRLTFEKKRFTYHNPTNLEQNRRWVFVEYSCVGSDWVVCRLSKNTGSRNRPESDWD
ncbi:NAC domain-containing protein 105 [Linum perenne]